MRMSAYILQAASQMSCLEESENVVDLARADISVGSQDINI